MHVFGSDCILDNSGAGLAPCQALRTLCFTLGCVRPLPGIINDIMGISPPFHVFLCILLLIGTACSHPPDAGLGPVPVQDAWAACLATADGRGTELAVIADAPTDAPGLLQGYAEHTAWYRNDQPVTLNGRRYARFGYLRRLDPDGFAAHGRELVKVGEREGVPLYAEGPDSRPPSILWVPLRPGCLFQSYQRTYTDGHNKRDDSPPPTPPDVTVPIKVCVIDQTGVGEVDALFRPTRGDTVVSQGTNSVPLEIAHPPGTAFVEGKRWYSTLESLQIFGRRYDAYSRPLTITPAGLREHGTAMHRVGTYDGVAIFTERKASEPPTLSSASKPPRLLYLPVRPGCQFQPYIDSAARVF